MFQELRYGVRMLLKRPGFALMAVFTLALGIGLTTAIFSLAHSILLRALPYPDASRLVTISLTNTVAAASGVPRFRVSAVSWLEWRKQSTLFDDIALDKPAVSFNLTGDGGPERVQGDRVVESIAGAEGSVEAGSTAFAGAGRLWNRFRKETRLSRSTMCVRWRTGSGRVSNHAVC